VQPMPTATSKEAAESFVNYCGLVLGFPESILNDQETHFMGSFTGICHALSQPRVTTTAYHPSSNGIVERLNGPLKDMIQRTRTHEMTIGINKSQT
jgi:hypothetical protein